MLAHQAHGAGSQPVIALHGFLGSSRNLRSLLRAWTGRDPGLKVWALDLLGHGASPPLPPEPSLEDLAQAVLQTLDELGVESARFVGHSLGGRVSLRCRALAPERVDAIDLLDITPGPIPVTDTDQVIDALSSAPDRAPDREPIVRHLKDRGLPDGLVEWLSMNLERAPSGDLSWRIDRERLAKYHHGTRGQSLWWIVESFPRAIRLLRGGRSPFVTAEDVARFDAMGVPVATIDGAGHFVHVDATEAVVDWLSRSSQ